MLTRCVSVLAAAGVAVALTAWGAVATALLSSAPAGAATCTITWTGNAGDQQWTTARNWTPRRVPGSSDVVCIPSTYRGPAVQSTGSGSVSSLDAEGTSGFLAEGTLKLAQPSTVLGLNLAPGGNLDVASGAALTLTGTSYWNGGYITGAGATTIPSGATAYWLGNGGTQSPLTNQGSIKWYSGNPCLGGKGTFTNDATFTVLTDVSYFTDGCQASGGTPGMTNGTGGSVIVDATPNQTADIQVPFTNLGSVTIDSGNLELDGGDVATTQDAGSYTIAGGSALDLADIAATRRLTSAASITGTGTLDVSGTLQLAGQTISSLEQTSGTLAGAFTLSGTGVWSGGTIQNIGTAASTTTVASGATLLVDGSTALDHNMVNQGTVDWSAGSPCLGKGAVLTNDATMNLTADEQYLQACDTSKVALMNAATATITRSGGQGTCAYVDTPFNNKGTVTVASGNLQLGGGDLAGSSDTGSYSIASGGQLFLSAGTRKFASGSTLNGPGMVNIDGGTAVFSKQTVPNLQLNAGAAEGAFTMTGQAVLAGGVISDAGAASTSTVVAKGSSAVIDGGPNIEHSLTNNGSLTWESGDPCFGDGNNPTTFANHGTFTITAYTGDSGPCGGAPKWLNASGATWVINVPGGVTEKYKTINDGTLDLEQGTLTVASSWTSGTGSTLGTTVDGTGSPAFGQLTVDYGPNLAGTLAITTSSGFAPQPGDTFPAVVSNGDDLTGTFSTVTGTSLPSGDSYSVAYTSAGATLDVNS